MHLAAVPARLPVCLLVCRRVQNLFHSVQLNVNNPHFLIMQGRITKVGWTGTRAEEGSTGAEEKRTAQWRWLHTVRCVRVRPQGCMPRTLLSTLSGMPAAPQVLNMKPPEILGLLEEAAGTKMYEDKKKKALHTLEKKQLKVDEINKVGAHVKAIRGEA